VLFLLMLLQAPAPPSEAPQTVPPMSLERAIRELERPTISFDQKPAEPPTFRVEVRGLFPIEPWSDGQTSPWRMNIPRTHYEFLSMVTPEDFRAATLHPCCLDLVPIFASLGDYLEASGRARREARAKRIVEQALRDWRAVNAKDK
jgi:hypothetical protein